MNTEKVLPKLPNLSFTLVGRVESKRTHEGKHYTEVLCPAKDTYSMPSVFELRSSYSLGEQGSEINVTVSLGGNIKKFKFKDRNTGEMRDGRDASCYLDVA